MLQTLTGQVFSMEDGKFKKSVAGGGTEERTWIRFRLGADKPYKEEVQVAGGGTEEMRQKTFITTKAFNGLADTIKQYFGGDENKGKWIQVFGHWEEETYNQKVDVDNPANANEVLELEIPVKRLVFMVSHFNFIGPAPQPKTPQAKSSTGVGVKVKTKTTVAGSSASDAERALAGSAAGPNVGGSAVDPDDEAPF
ncbi:hypothetical protein D3C85_684350 [compost metagenome]